MYIFFISILDESRTESKEKEIKKNNDTLNESKDAPKNENVSKNLNAKDTSKIKSSSLISQSQNINKYLFSNRSLKPESSSLSLKTFMNRENKIKNPSNTLRQDSHEWRDENELKRNSPASALSNISKYISFQESIGSFDSESLLLDTSRTSPSSTKVSTRQISTPHEWRDEDIVFN